MNVVVIETFQDKYDRSRSYAPGTVLEWEDPERIKDCSDRGLIEVCEEITAETGEDLQEDPDQETGYMAREDLEDMKVKDLKRLAADMGIDTAKLKKKTELIGAICKQEVIPGSEACEE